METTPAPETPPRRYIAGHTYRSHTVHALAHDPDKGEISKNVYDYGPSVCGLSGRGGFITERTAEGELYEWDPEEDAPMKSCHKCRSVILAADPSVFMDEDIQDLI